MLISLRVLPVRKGEMMSKKESERLVIYISGESARKMELASQNMKLAKSSVIRQALELFYKENKIK
jgi:NMD protein affecting ribosome stability and mRNA decay